MKKTTRILSTISILTLLFVLMSCGNSNKTELLKEFEQQKKQAIERLETLNMDVDKALKDIKNNLTVNEERLKGIQDDILERKEMLTSTIKKAKSATEQEWKSMKTEVDETASSLEENLDAFKEDIKSAIGDLKEGVSEAKEEITGS